MTTINGRPIDEPIHLETLPLTMNFEHHLEDVIFDIYPTGAYDIILGLPWLRAHNPEISWDNEHIRFTRCDCNREKPLSAPAAITSYDWWQRLGLLREPAIPNDNDDDEKVQIEVINEKQMRKHLRCQRTHVFTCMVQPIK